MNVYTSRIDILGRDPDALDITRAGAKARPSGPGVAFAPSWDLLLRGKRGELTCEQYTAEMRESYRRRRDDWRALLARERVVLCCYCTDPKQCHRSVFARILAKLGARPLGELPTVRALSVRQPWAWAILHGKDIENRGGRTWERGPIPGPEEPIALHASAGCTREEYEDAAASIEFIAEHVCAAPVRVPPFAELPRGGIVGRFRIPERVTESDSPWWSGPIGLRIADAEPLPFAACAGALGFFRVPAWMAGTRL